MKTILCLITILSNISVFAAYQYGNLNESNVVTKQYKNKYFEGYGGNYYTPTLNIKSKLYIVDDIRSRYSTYDANNRSVDNILSDFGYVDTNGNKISWTNNTTTANKIDTGWNGIINQTAYEIGTFDPGKEITLWMTNNFNETIYSNIPQYFNYQGGYGFTGNDIFGNTLAFSDFNIGKDLNFSIAYEGISDVPPISGQPLPGVLTSLFIGLGTLGVVKTIPKLKGLQHKNS